MIEIKTFLKEMFQEDNGGYSCIRLVTLLWFLGFVPLYVFACIHAKAILDIPGGVNLFTGALLGAKVWQKNQEQKINP